MILTFILRPIWEVVSVTVSALITVAFVTVAERKTMASMQRRVGPNIVGFYGLLQPFADALKLLLKEYVSPTQSNIVLFFLGPIITLVFSLLGFVVVPYGPGLSILDFDLGILYMLAMSSLSTYGILLAGWSANSKYAFLGSLRSTAQLISYELILSSAILLVVLLSSSLSLTTNIESQKAVWYLLPLLPIFIIFFIGCIAETNRAPFDLAEAESELVSGFMTEHAAVIFVFFFLAEYASIVLICILACMLFLAGYLFNFVYPSTISEGLDLYSNKYLAKLYVMYHSFINLPVVEGFTYGLNLGLKSCIMIFTFILVRASFPRIRYDQLMSFCWTILLPVIIALIIIFPCILYSFSLLVSSHSLLLVGFIHIKNHNQCEKFVHICKKTVYRLINNLLEWIKGCPRLIIGSIIIRTLAFCITSILVYMGIQNHIVSYFITGCIITLLAFSIYKSKNKKTHIYKFIVNITFLTLFWSCIFYLSSGLVGHTGQAVIYTLLVKYAVYSSHDWHIDLSDIMDQFNFHSTDMNDSSTLPPNIDPLCYNPDIGEHDERKN